MPKKPNRTDLQNYVPAGNGDESGEYRGGTSTSEGMHDSDCENYRKVLEAKKEALGNAFNPASKPEEELVRDPNKQSTEFNKEKYFKTYTLNDKDTSFFVSKYDEMNDFGKKQIAELSSKMDTRFDRSLSGTGSFVVHLNDLNGGTVIIPGDDNRANRVMAHEYGHAIDFNFGEEGVFASSSVHLSNGRTMEDAVCNHANAVDRSRISDLFYEFHDEVGKLTSKVCEQEGISKEDIERATSLNTELARTEAQFYHETYNNRELQGRKEEIMNKKVAEKGFSPSEIDTLKKIYKRVSEIKSKSLAELQLKWAVISDYYGYIDGEGYLMGCGHSVDYYRKRGGYSAVTREVFAELTEQRFNDEANYQFTKSKMPDVVEAYEELYNKIKSGVIKSLKERRG